MTPVERFQLLLKRTEELFSTRLARNQGLAASFSMRWDQAGTRFSIANPDEDDLRSYLMTYRHFISNNEPVFVNRVYNTLWSELDCSSPLREELAKAQAYWRHHCVQGFVSPNIDGEAFRPELIQDLYINGIYFHNDSRKRATLESLVGVSALLARHGFLDLLVVGSRYIAFLRAVIIAAANDGLINL